MTTRIGWTAEFHIINLNTGGVFIFERTVKGAVIPPDTTAEFEWDNGKTWPGTVDGQTISWRITADQIALIPHLTTYTIWITYPNGNAPQPDRYPWYRGYGERFPNP